MKCPTCDGVQLVMSERSGIEIDYCPQCRGVWLDRGELDKIIERAAADSPQAAPVAAPVPAPPGYPPQHARDGYYKENYYRKKKRSGFLGELFDFD